jgi:hypothetical protein
MRFASLLIAVCCVAGSALGQAKDFQEPCASHIQSAWPEEVRKAAQADCVFSDESRKTGAVAWVNAASEDVAIRGVNGRDQLRTLFEKVYAKKGFQLLWYPTGGSVFRSYVVTTGNYERHILDESGKETVTHGYYVTMWKKQKDGNYQLVWDDGE